MAWRLHLTNQAIYQLDILTGPPTLLAVWTRRDRVAFYAIETGTLIAERNLDFPTTADRRSDEWQEFVAGLIAPNRSYLPTIAMPELTIYLSDDGRMRLYETGDTNLYMDAEGKEVKLHVSDAAPFVAVTMDRFLGVTAALDERGKLHVYQQNIRVGNFDLGLKFSPDLPPSLAIARGGGSIFASNGRQIVLTNSSGKIRKEFEAHYFIGRMDCSPNGRLLVTSDMETGVLRLYNGIDLLPMRQRFAIDLLVEAVQVQLLADMPPIQVALSTLALADDGLLAFAMSGVVCLTDITTMDELPRPQRLI